MTSNFSKSPKKSALKKNLSVIQQEDNSNLEQVSTIQTQNMNKAVAFRELPMQNINFDNSQNNDGKSIIEELAQEKRNERVFPRNT